MFSYDLPWVPSMDGLDPSPEKAPAVRQPATSTQVRTPRARRRPRTDKAS